MLIQRVSKDSFAEKMGLQGGFFKAEILSQKLWLGGDIILEILGSSCEKPHSLRSIKEEIEGLSPGEEIYLKILRHGEIIDIRKKI